MATRNARETASDQTAAPATPAQEPAPVQPAQKQAGLSPADAAKAISSPGKPVTSARFNVRLTAQELAGRRERETVTFTGAFQGSGPAKVPSYQLTARQTGSDGVEVDRVLSTGERGFVFKGGTAYAVPERTMKGLALLRGEIAKGTTGQTAASAPAVDPSSWLKDLKAAKPAKVDGVATTHVTGRVAPSRAADNFVAVAKTVAKSADQPSTLPRGLRGKIAGALKSARLDAHVGTSDRILRRMRLSVTGTIPKELRDEGESARWRTVLDVRLAGVNKPQRISAPKNASERPAERALGAKRYRGANGVLTLAAVYFDTPAGVAQSTASMLRAAALGRAARKPRAVERAVNANKRVVIFFHQRNGVDDPVTAQAVAGLKRRTSATVFIDSIENLTAYGQVVTSLGVTRAPSVVIIGKSGRARLIEGYIDPTALAQEVADTR